MRWMLWIACLFLLAGCFAKVTVDKRPNLALPIYYDATSTNVKDYVIVDQGYKVKYSKMGFSTDIEQLSAEISTNKNVKFTLGGLHSTAITNSIQIKIEDLVNLIKTMRTGTNDVFVLEK